MSSLRRCVLPPLAENEVIMLWSTSQTKRSPHDARETMRCRRCIDKC